MFALFTFFISCTKQTCHDQVKFDFYKKNAKVIYKTSSIEIPFYKSDLVIELLDSINEYKCYYGTFSNNGIILNKSRNSTSIEAVNTICYDDKMNIINWYIESMEVSFIHDSFRIKEDKYFEKILLEKETNQFLTKYKPK